MQARATLCTAHIIRMICASAFCGGGGVAILAGESTASVSACSSCAVLPTLQLPQATSCSCDGVRCGSSYTYIITAACSSPLVHCSQSHTTGTKLERQWGKALSPEPAVLALCCFCHHFNTAPNHTQQTLSRCCSKARGCSPKTAVISVAW